MFLKAYTFNASFGEANEGRDLFWNEYWGWNLMSLSVECYGNLNFAGDGDNTDTNPGTFDIVLMVAAVATLSGMGVAASKKTRR